MKFTEDHSSLSCKADTTYLWSEKKRDILFRSFCLIFPDRLWEMLFKEENSDCKIRCDYSGSVMNSWAFNTAHKRMSSPCINISCCAKWERHQRRVTIALSNFCDSRSIFFFCGICQKKFIQWLQFARIPYTMRRMRWICDSGIPDIYPTSQALLTSVDKSTFFWHFQRLLKVVCLRPIVRLWDLGL